MDSIYLFFDCINNFPNSDFCIISEYHFFFLKNFELSDDLTRVIVRSTVQFINGGLCVGNSRWVQRSSCSHLCQILHLPGQILSLIVPSLPFFLLIVMISCECWNEIGVNRAELT